MMASHCSPSTGSGLSFLITASLSTCASNLLDPGSAGDLVPLLVDALLQVLDVVADQLREQLVRLLSLSLLRLDSKHL